VFQNFLHFLGFAVQKVNQEQREFFPSAGASQHSRLFWLKGLIPSSGSMHYKRVLNTERQTVFIKPFSNTIIHNILQGFLLATWTVQSILNLKGLSSYCNAEVQHLNKWKRPISRYWSCKVDAMETGRPNK